MRHNCASCGKRFDCLLEAGPCAGHPNLCGICGKEEWRSHMGALRRAARAAHEGQEGK
jgi:hypothetical protein